SRMPTIISDSGSNVFYEKTDTATRERVAGHFRHAHTADTPLRSCARAPDWQAHSADNQRLPANAAWFALSRFAPPGAKGLGGVQVGNGPGLQPRVQVLPADGEGQEAAGGGGVAVEADGRGCGAGDVAGGPRNGRGELR